MKLLPEPQSEQAIRSQSRCAGPAVTRSQNSAGGFWPSARTAGSRVVPRDDSFSSL